jgi:putative ABC transport system permease protein
MLNDTSQQTLHPSPATSPDTSPINSTTTSPITSGDRLYAPPPSTTQQPHRSPPRRSATGGLIAAWLGGLLRRRLGRLLASAAGIALAVGLLASIGAFLSSSKSTMTKRAVNTVAVDWQVQAQAGSDPAQIHQQVAGANRVKASEPVAFLRADGLELTKDGSSQTTGAAQILGINSTYQSTFPEQIRPLLGAKTGVLLYQQTAANLQATAGDTITIRLAGFAPITVKVDGIVDVPQADSLFQTVGAPIGAQPQAPPDNVVFLPMATWHKLFDPSVSARPDLIVNQIHVRLDHHLPSDPSAAYSSISGQARNLEVQLHGGGLVGDNLGATLAAARKDALYAQILFLFLGVPGAVLAGLITFSVATAGRDRRRREQALLRTRGATTSQLTHLGAAEAILTATVGGIAGLGLALVVARFAFGTTRFGASTVSAIGWCVASVLAGFGIAIGSIALPARRDAIESTVTFARRVIGRDQAPRWMRFKLDVILLATAILIFWLTSRSGYHLVLAVEGVPTISVSYWAFAGPALLWIGAGLLTYRLTHALAGRGRRQIAALLRPSAKGLSDTIAATLARQRRTMARAVALVALTVGFAASTAIFNATYRQQAEIDAVLSNGADVTATTSPGTRLSPSFAKQLTTTTGVRHVEAIQHRFAYIGADLQDLYGVDPSTIVAAGRLQNAYFEGGTAKELLAILQAKPDSLLVSSETVRDFQLQPGDSVTLGLQDGRTKQYRNVAFHYEGVAKEFPTAPHDSFFIANANYVATQTGTDAVGAFLIDTGGRNVTKVADALRSKLGAQVTVTDIASERKVIGSSLTAVDLAGLTRVELGFALALAAAATGLTLWLGLAERRRTFTITTALGATPRQLGSFVWAEAGLVTITGLGAGAAIAWALANMLVKVLYGVFDPAPSVLAVPWTYLVAVLGVALAATATSARISLAASKTAHVELLRAL